MATITIRKELQDFLEKEGVLESFIENSKEYIKGEGHIGCVMSAFLWQRTKEGFDYWHKIYNKWLSYSGENGIV